MRECVQACALFILRRSVTGRCAELGLVRIGLALGELELRIGQRRPKLLRAFTGLAALPHAVTTRKLASPRLASLGVPRQASGFDQRLCEALGVGRSVLEFRPTRACG